jgi:HNH endonuclease
MVFFEIRLNELEQSAVQHYVAYQNSDEWGAFRRARKNQKLSWFTAKRFRDETLVGNRLWGFEGSGSPRGYRFVVSGIISHLSDTKRPRPWLGVGKLVHFSADIVSRTDVTNKPWFKKLLREQRNFSMGLRMSSERSVITALEALRNDELGDKGGHNDTADVPRLDNRGLPELVWRAIQQRRGQPKFRSAVLNAYECKCAISGSDVEEAVEAAHIIPFNGGRSDRLSNALLLRADLHTLFDLGLLSVNPRRWTVVVGAALRRTEYGNYHGKKIHLPRDKKYWPSPSKLDQHRRASGL